jgi:para-nitrobenzyl esterase
LNVWTPSATFEEKLPVYVFIHGGAYATGSGSELVFDGTHMARKNVVVVTINYRLGAFGFLATNGLFEESKTAGNFGLLDQIMALKWVKVNISAFGGDPKRVTVGGESAGAFSVTALMLSPKAEGLFHQAIVESGSIFSLPAFARHTHGDLNRTLKEGSRFCEVLGIEDSIEGLDELRRLSADILAAYGIFKQDQSNCLRSFSFWPVYDGVVLPKDPVAALKEGRYNKVKLLIGYNTNESSLFIKSHTNKGIYEMLMCEIFGSDGGKKVLDYFPLNENKNAVDRLQEVFTLAGFIIGMVMMAEQYAIDGEVVYFYNFDYDPAILKLTGYNTAHAMELPFVFGNFIGKTRATKIGNLSFFMQESWVNFIKTGNPNADEDEKGKITWPKFNCEDKYMMVFDNQLGNTTLPNQKDLVFLREIMFDY